MVSSAAFLIAFSVDGIMSNNTPHLLTSIQLHNSLQNLLSYNLLLVITFFNDLQLIFSKSSPFSV